jgi:alkanesulfonate monooxygenase SsuD/methylene tetrahydromethanopterin reductase-like flavin-dependent oxidoreductase (luciferase family)
MSTPFYLGIALDGAGWHPSAWREAEARPGALFDADYWVSLVVEARSAGIDLVTIEDSFGLQTGGFGAVELRGDEVRGRLDALLLANTVAAQVPGIGIVPTVTTTHTEPFHTATGIQTLDHVSEGWAGWRVQISGRSHEAAHLGRREIPALDPVAVASGVDETQTALIRSLFSEAADAIEVARRLWDSWEDDAVIRDVATGRFLDRDRVHYIDFEGENFSVKGPSIVPRSPQGQPLVYVLAHQTVPYELAVAQADIVGITPHGDEHLGQILAELRDAAGRVERRAPESLRVWGEAVVLIEETTAAARAALATLDELHGSPYASDALVLADTAENVAAQLLRWRAAGLDGVRLRPARLPLDLERIARGVVPVLAETGVLQRAIGAGSLRERLGFARPTNRYAAELIESAHR